jgi:glucuronoarabinoxylan endo-1,4-beta-xylanase
MSLAARRRVRRSKMKLSKSFLAGFLLLFFYTPHTQAQTATINWNNVDQVIDGFGASDAVNGGNNLSSSNAQFLFSQTSGIGLSLLRTEVPDDGSCTSVSSACAGVYVPDMQAAISYGAKVWATPWSPPASMKSNGSVDNGGSLLAGSYGAYATYLANFVKSLSSLDGISLYAISVQNEPDQNQPYDSAIWSAVNFDTFIGTNLGPTFASDGLTGTLIIMPEPSGYGLLTTYAGTTMADSTAAAYVGINAWHDYDNASSVTNPYASQGKKYWETEVSGGSGFGPSLCGGCWDPSMADALMWAAIIDDRMAVANANAWHYWWLVDQSTTDNEGLIGGASMNTISKRAYMMGNYSKFVRPGFNRIDATHTPQSGILVSAYKNSTSGALVIVAINQNSSSVSQPFTLNGTTASSMTPWITSAGLNLAAQSAVTVSDGSFTYSLPASSITTFVGNTTTTSVPPAAPTQLTATIE